MGRILIILALVYLKFTTVLGEQSILSSVLTPTDTKKSIEPITSDKLKSLSRQGRSYYDFDRYYGRPLYERLEHERPRCSRCDDRDDRDDYDRSSSRDRYDDDRRHHPTLGSRNDRNRYDDANDDDDRRYKTDRRDGNDNKNGTEENNGDKKDYDDKDRRPSGSRRGGNRNRDRDRDRYDDRERYRPNYYDRFLRDPYRERPYYDDTRINRERRPLYDRYPYDDGFAGRLDNYGYQGYRRPAYDDRYDRGYDDGYGGYGPGVGRGPHDSFRPWDETYRGQAGWDAGGRGYYFASGRPEVAAAAAPAVADWSRNQYYNRPTESGWQSAGYAGGYTGYRDPLDRSSLGYRDPLDRGALGYQDPYRQDLAGSYGRPSASGWYSVGERRPYRDQSGVNQLDDRERGYQSHSTRKPQSYGQRGQSYGQIGQDYGQGGQSYGQGGQTYGQGGQNYGHSNAGTNGYSSSTTPGTSYLFQRTDEQVSTKLDDTTKPSSSS